MIKIQSDIQKPDFPQYLAIETLRACNARCRMCKVLHRQGTRMSDKLFFKILQEVAQYANWIKRINISGYGEPLLDSTLPEKIHCLKNHGIGWVNISTNASLLDQDLSCALIDSGLDEIMLSIDGIKKKTYESIRRGLNFESVMENCLRFIKVRNQRRPSLRVQIRMVLQEQNRHEEAQWKDFWLDHVAAKDIVCSKSIHSWGNQLDGVEDFVDHRGSKQLPCISPWSTMVIHFDGTVPLCCIDFDNKQPMGNINHSSIRECWNSQAFNQVRQKHASGRRDDLVLCRNCRIWEPQSKMVYQGKMNA